jgi:hypothetical protein
MQIKRFTPLKRTSDGNVTIGRDRKRLISAMIHHFILGQLDRKSIAHLQGLIGFAQDVEPLFVAKLRGKYTSKVITELMRLRDEKRN